MEFRIFEDRLTMASFQKLRLECGMELLESSMLRKALDHSLVQLTAERDGKVIGMLRVAGDCSYIFVLSDVLVHPDYRKNGVGSALCMYALECIKRFIPKGCYTTVSLFAAPGKEKFYRRLGFFDLPGSRGGPGMQAIIKNDRGEASAPLPPFGR